MSRLERILFIHDVLARGEHPTYQQLQTWCECSADTISRDLAVLRAVLDAPIIRRNGRLQYARSFSLDAAARMIPCPLYQS